MAKTNPPSDTTPNPDEAVTVKTVTVKALVPVAYDQRPMAVGETFDVRQADLEQLLGVQAVVLVSGD